jgi:hypothetical protein
MCKSVGYPPVLDLRCICVFVFDLEFPLLAFEAVLAFAFCATAILATASEAPCGQLR